MKPLPVDEAAIVGVAITLGGIFAVAVVFGLAVRIFLAVSGIRRTVEKAIVKREPH
jgi:hypothetical protein